jgi:rhodanese-related sulfurtransferase
MEMRTVAAMMSMRRGIAVLLAACLPMAPLAAAQSDAAISQAQLLERMQSGQAPALIDVRSPEEFESGHIPGAINIPLQSLPRRVNELAAYQERELVLYCEIGGRAARGSDWLASRGFQQLRLLDGHMSAWRGAGLPTER